VRRANDKRANRNICAGGQLAELKTRYKLVILIRHVVFYSESCTHAQILLFRRACRLLAAHVNFFVTNDEKYQTCLIFGLQVTNDENAVNVARTRGNFVDPTYSVPCYLAGKSTLIACKASFWQSAIL
jgi:hypothetical protein